MKGIKIQKRIVHSLPVFKIVWLIECKLRTYQIQYNIKERVLNKFLVGRPLAKTYSTIPLLAHSNAESLSL
jgi:hypothetical protein